MNFQLQKKQISRLQTTCYVVDGKKNAVGSVTVPSAQADDLADAGSEQRHRLHHRRVNLAGPLYQPRS
jgi:hypothetical protein